MNIDPYDIMRYVSIVINQAPIQTIRLNHLAHSERLMYLSSGTRYRICVLGVGNWHPAMPAPTTPYLPVLPPKAYGIRLINDNDDNDSNNNNNNNNRHDDDESVGDGRNRLDLETDNGLASPDGLLKQHPDTSTMSRCAYVRTLDATPSLITDENGLSGQGFIHSILTRRLGLIVGCCLGIFVFIVLISVLGWLKLKKQRIENAKRQQQQIQQQQHSHPSHHSHTNAHHHSQIHQSHAGHLQLPVYPYFDDTNHHPHQQQFQNAIGTTKLTC